MYGGANEQAIELTEQTLQANEELQQHLDKYIVDLESEQDKLDALINNLAKLESTLPEDRVDDEVVVETAPYGANYEKLPHVLTTRQIWSEGSPFYQAAMQRQRYEIMTTTRPFTRDEQRLLHVNVIIENKRLHALRARARGEDPFAAIENHPDEFFDKLDPEISWSSVAQNMASNPSRTADQCRIMYVSTELPSINRSDWTSEEFESLRAMVETHNERSAEPVEDIEEQREMLRIDWVEVARELETNRTALQCLRRFVLEPIPGREGPSKPRQRPPTTSGSARNRTFQAGDRSTGQVWSKEEDVHLLEGVQRYGMGNWPEVALHVNSAMSGTPGHVARNPNQCSFRYSKSLAPTIKKGKWTREEDEALRKGFAAFGRTWIKVQEYVHGRTDAQCRERWSNMLDPNLKTGPWDAEEDQVLLDAASRKLPWSAVAALLPGRTDSRCAKRYQILMKPGRASATTAGASTSQKRTKKQKESNLDGENQAEKASEQSAGVTPGAAHATDESPVIDTTRRSRARPKPKTRDEGASSTPTAADSGLDVLSGEAAMDGQPDDSSSREGTNRTAQAEDFVESTVAQKTKKRKAKQAHGGLER